MVYYIWKSFKLNIPAVRVFEAISGEKKVFFLDSSLIKEHSSRYSFLGIDPFKIYSSKFRDPFSELRAECAKYDFRLPGNKIPFLCGAVGYLAYDLGFSLENSVKRVDKPDPGIPEAYFGFYNNCIIIDHQKKLLHILVLGFPEKKEYLQKKLAKENLQKLSTLIFNFKNNKSAVSKVRQAHDLKSDFTKLKYIQAVKQAKDYIKQGDIYQVNLAQQFSAKSHEPAAEIYQRLRQISPAASSAFFDAGDFQLISSSPESFLKVTQGMVSTRPMKGTRPRSQDKIKDNRFRRDLLISKKEQAELMMIVDLERNDLGRVCDYATIKAASLRQIEKYKTVYQATATITGRLHKLKDNFDLLRASFPGGSIVGCPKIRAMQIIEELEPSRRSIYTGSLGYLSFSGDMEFNIMIRTILKHGSDIRFGVGSGIVADSFPSKEYAETLIKAKGILKAIGR